MWAYGRFLFGLAFVGLCAVAGVWGTGWLLAEDEAEAARGTSRRPPR
ncbi:hypothetical protein SAMN05444722_1434 [Rhodovulum sp. ES.010]|nr:hypothetical protein SAMN05444722_1434 [Rhodovulum sp. ES.010]